MVKKTTVYVEDKGPSSQSKMENTQKGGQRNAKGAKGGKGSWGPNKGSGPKAQVQIITWESTSELPSGIVMVVAGRGTIQNKKGNKNQTKKGKGNPARVGRNYHRNAPCVEMITL